MPKPTKAEIAEREDARTFNLVVEAIAANPNWIRTEIEYNPNRFRVRIHLKASSHEVDGFGDTLPLAVCLAALKALNVKVEGME